VFQQGITERPGPQSSARPPHQFSMRRAATWTQGLYRASHEWVALRCRGFLWMRQPDKQSAAAPPKRVVPRNRSPTPDLRNISVTRTIPRNHLGRQVIRSRVLQGHGVPNRQYGAEHSKGRHCRF
jgi:hypothetical protein